MPDAPPSPPSRPPLFRMRAIGRLAAAYSRAASPVANIRMQRVMPTTCDVLYRGTPALPNPHAASKTKRTSRVLPIASPVAPSSSASSAAAAAHPSPFLTASLLPWSGLLVVDKPADVCIDSAPSMLDASAAASPRTTTLESLAYEALTSLEPVEAGSPSAGKIKLRPCHQLDHSTSGVMVYALDSESAHRVAALFASRRTHKIYVALVHGHPAAESIMCDEPLGSMHEPVLKEFREQMGSWGDPGRSAVTIMHVLEKGYMRFNTADAASASSASTLSPVSLVALLPQSGRRHQLRLHMRHAGHSIVGDLAYSSPSLLAKDQVSPRMMLHAWKLQLPLEQSDEQAPPPPCEAEQTADSPSASSSSSTASANASATAVSCCSSSGSSSITFQTRSNPFAGLLSNSARTRFWSLHHAPHAHVLAAPRHLGSDQGGVLVLAKDPHGRMCVLLTKYARSRMTSHLDVKPADIVLPFAPARRDSAGSAPAPTSPSSAATCAASSSSSASVVPPRLNLNGSMWSLPALARVPHDADVADAAARSLSMFLSPLAVLKGLESSDSNSSLIEGGCDAVASNPASESFATLQLARHFRRANGNRLGVLELPSPRPHDASSVSQTIFMVHAHVDPQLLSSTASHAWLPVADLFAGIAPAAGVPSAALPPASVVAPSATPLLLLRSLNRSWSVSSLLLAVMQHSCVLGWMGGAESQAPI